MPEAISRDPSAPVKPIHAVNLALRFLLELAALAALAVWGVHAGHSPGADVALGVGAPLLATILWGTYAAPRAPRQLEGTPLAVIQLTVLLAGAAALAAAAHVALGVILAVIVLANAALLRE